MSRATRPALLALGILLAAVPAQAQSLPSSLTTYFGQDTENAPYTSVPPDGNAATARAAFDGSIRLETVGLQSFEQPEFTAQNSAASFASLNVTFQGSGNSPTTQETVTASFTGAGGNQYTIRDDGSFGTFATEGSQYLGSDNSNITVDFDTPVSAFGFYGTDFGEGGTTSITLTLTDTDGATFSFTQDLVPGRTGNVLFTGFTDQEKLYDRVAISANNDNEFFGFDSFIIADVNQVTGAEYADPINDINDPNDNVAGAASAIEGETVRLLLRTDGTGAGTITVELVGGTGSSADVDGFTSQTLSILDGDNVAALPIRTTADGVTDDGETFVFRVTAATGSFADSYTAGPAGDTFTLTVGDPLPVFTQSFTPSPATEDQPTSYTFTIDNSGRGGAASGLAFSTTLPNGLAVASPSGANTTCGGTVTASGQGVEFSGGAVAPDASCSVTVDVVPSATGDYTLPPVFLNTDRGATQAEGTTLSVQRGVSFSAASGSASEGGTVTLTATLSSAAPAGGASVQVALTSGNAADLGGYTTQTLTFAAGETTASTGVTVTDDGETEAQESFTFTLQNASGAVIANPSTFDLTVAASGPRAAFTATGGADPAQTDNGATISVDAVEGDAITLTITLSDGAAGGESVDVVLVTGTPTTGQAADLGTPADSDGPYQTQTVTFAQDQTSATVTIPVVADGVAEPEELVRLALQNAQGGLTLGGASAFDLTIAESFAGASFAAATASADEGDTVTITLELSAPAQGGEAVDVVLSPNAPTTGSAADLGSYTTQTVTFAAGETTATLTVPVTADGLAEPAETFRFTLDGVTDPSGQQTFDLAVSRSFATAAFARASAAATEGDEVTVTVNLTGPARGGEAVDVVLTEGDPADVDGFTTRTVTFAAGETSSSFTVEITEDGVADRDEAVTFELQNPVDLDLGSPTTFDLAIDQTGSFASFDKVQDAVAEGAGTYAMAFTLSEGLDSPATVTLSLASGDPADLGGFTSRTVEIPAGATSFVVEVPITDDAAREGNETFAFVLSDAQGNEPDGISLDRSTFSLIVVDNDGAGGGGGAAPVVVTTPPRDLDDDGVEDGGPQLLAVPVDGLTAADVAAAAAGDGPAPTVFVLDPATGALVAADPTLVLLAGQPVYVDVAPGADLSFEGDAPGGVVPFEPAASAADDGRVVVAVGNPFGEPVRLSDLVVEGGTLADVVLVMNPATGAFEPVSLASLEDGADILAAYGTVLVQVIPDGDGDDVRVTLRRDDTDGTLNPAATGLAGDRCPRSLGDEVVVCVVLGVGGDAPDERDRVAVRLRPAADDLRGQGSALDPYDGLDLTGPDGVQLSLPGGADGDARLAALSTPFAPDSVVTVPLTVEVDAPGPYTLTLARVAEAFQGQDLDVILVDRETQRVLDPSAPYAFEVETGEDLTGRFALVIGRPQAVSTDAADRPALADRVGTPFPNPTAGGAALAVEVSEAQAVRVAVYDALGRAVAVAFDGTVRPGTPARIALPTAGLAPGVYVVRVDGRTVREARRMTVAR